MCLTSLQNLLNLDVVGAEAAVEFEVVGVVEEGAPQGEQQLLWTQRGEGAECVHRNGECTEMDGGEKVQTCECLPSLRVTLAPPLLSFASHLTILRVMDFSSSERGVEPPRSIAPMH